MPTDLKTQISESLQGFSSKPLREASTDLLNSLGYESKLTADWSLEDFVRLGETSIKPLSAGDKKQLRTLKSLHLIFQVGDAEISTDADLFDSTSTVDEQRIHSYLFFAAELPPDHYTRTALSAIVRAINKPLPMPAFVIFLHGEAISFGIIHRRLHKRDSAKDVLEKVTLIKDIACADPIRAHLEILNDFALENLRNDFGVHNFVSLHRAWEKRLGTFALNERFYREVADWYFWARHQIDDGTIVTPRSVDTDPERSLFLIRLLTRLIFCWFLMEKRLLPRDLFKPESLGKLLRHFDTDGEESGDFYCAVLQNLFFATLNQPTEDRGFRGKSASGRFDPNRGSTNLYRYADRFHDPAKWESLIAGVPFLNGGLFECLDHVFQKDEKTDDVRLDDFSEEKTNHLLLPDALFFGKPRPVDLSSDYGDKKKTARSRKAEVRGLIEIFSRYKFTIEENTPLEEEIALDPELLGKVFENLLASYNPETRDTARKQTGSFYTPREVVSYMVDEALLAYLEPFLPGDDPPARLHKLFATPSDEPIDWISDEEKDGLIRALDDVKILDPACGSGAFPMGALHRLVDILRKLDPENKKLKALQLLKLKAFPKEDQGSARQDIEDFFDTKRHDPDYARKICLIENSIFGVDIQPVAVQIAKLRFFIALICDQKTADKLPNRGVKPLPNLETRIVAANTLIPIEGAVSGALKQADLLDQRIDSLRAALRKVRHDHFSARDPRKKRKCRERDAELRDEIATILKENGLPAGTAKDLADNDPYNQNSTAPFFDPVWMFGSTYTRPRQAATTLRGEFADIVNSAQTQGELSVSAKTSQPEVAGFEIVIGNPPYVRHEKIKDQKVEFKKHYQCFTGTADLYVYFYERALQLLRPGGVLSYITSNSYLNSAFGEKLRTYLAGQTRILTLIDFAETGVFTAITEPCVIVLTKGSADKNSLKALKWKETKRPENIAAITADESFPLPQSTFDQNPWQLEPPRIRKLLEGIRSVGVPLGQLVKGRFYRGVLTGLNEAFVVDIATRDRLVAEDPKCAEIIRPMLRGKDAGRWVPKYQDVWLIFTRRGIEIDAFPSIKDHLQAFRSQLEPRPKEWPKGKEWVGRKQGSYMWYEIQDNIAYWKEFSRPKIIYQEINRTCSFAYDHTGCLLNNKLFMIPDAELWLLAVLNSSICKFYLHASTGVPVGGFLALQSPVFEPLPIVSPSANQESLLSFFSEIMCFLCDSDTKEVSGFPRDPLMRSYYEQMLNALVYELYFPEELYDSGLHIFDLVEAADFPGLKGISDDADAKTKLRLLREKFEETYDLRHPLRAALQKLSTLNTVRIIEGKA